MKRTWLRAWDTDDWRPTRGARDFDTSPGIETRGGGEPLGPLVNGPVAGMFIANPAPAPPPERLLRCRCLTSFCFGQLADGTVRDLVEGEVVDLPERRARELVWRKTVELVADPIAQRARRTMELAERQARLAEAAQVAAGPQSAPVVVDPEPALRDPVKLRAKRAFSLGGGRDLQPGQLFECDEQSALYRIAAGLAEVVEPEPAEQPEARAAREQKRS